MMARQSKRESSDVADTRKRSDPLLLSSRRDDAEDLRDRTLFHVRKRVRSGLGKRLRREGVGKELDPRARQELIAKLAAGLLQTAEWQLGGEGSRCGMFASVEESERVSAIVRQYDLLLSGSTARGEQLRCRMCNAVLTAEKNEEEEARARATKEPCGTCGAEPCYANGGAARILERKQLEEKKRQHDRGPRGYGGRAGRPLRTLRSWPCSSR